METELIRLSIVVPTYNESENIVELVTRIEQCLGTEGWEIIFVDDDSKDNTAEIVRALGKKDLRVRCLQRVGRRGLASACIEGMLASSGDLVAIMDADLQHDERILPQMIEKIDVHGADIVVATRYSLGGTTGDWDSSRKKISRFATSVSRTIINDQVTDPMSGFFMLKREVINSVVHGLSGIGFKILLDILATARNKGLCIEEVPYTFRNRFKGESKLDQQVVWEFGMLLADKLFGRIMPVHFIAFSLIGGFGMLVHLLILTVLFQGLEMPFPVSHTIAALVAMVFNYTLNNELTYRDRRLRNWAWFKGLVVFVLCCSVGITANVGIATYVFKSHSQWIIAALSGIMIGAVWNFAATRFYAWRE
jgi:dolichol-phosphate mannosyltransferase